MKQLTKKEYAKRKPSKDNSHWEGGYFCDCRTRNVRKWLGIKMYGQLDLDDWFAGADKVMRD